MDFKVVLKETGQDTLLALKVIPPSSKNQLMGIESGELKVKIKAPPVEGAANEAVLGFISEILGLAKRNLSVERGEISRHKVVKIRGLSVRQTREALEKNHN